MNGCVLYLGAGGSHLRSHKNDVIMNAEGW